MKPSRSHASRGSLNKLSPGHHSVARKYPDLSPLPTTSPAFPHRSFLSLDLGPDTAEHQGVGALGVPQLGLRTHAVPLRGGPRGHVFPGHGAVLPQRPGQRGATVSTGVRMSLFQAVPLFVLNLRRNPSSSAAGVRGSAKRNSFKFPQSSPPLSSHSPALTVSETRSEKVVRTKGFVTYTC